MSRTSTTPQVIRTCKCGCGRMVRTPIRGHVRRYLNRDHFLAALHTLKASPNRPPKKIEVRPW